MAAGANRVAVLTGVCALCAAVCWAAKRDRRHVHAAGEQRTPERHVGHLEIWITDPAAGPYLSPLIWADGPQLAAGEAARLLGLTGGKSGQGHALVHLVRYQPGESLWVEQIGAKLGGITGRPANHYPPLRKLRSEKRYGEKKIFAVFIRGLTEDQYKSLHRFLRNLGEQYQRYAYGHPNCADLCADAWAEVFKPKLPPGPFWFPVDLGAHILNLPGKLHHRLSLFGKLSPIAWRNRTPDQVRRRLAQLGVAHRKKRAIGDLTIHEAKKVLAGR